MREIIISSISQYIDYINEIKNEGFIFYRGQDSHIEHKLLPSLLRERVDETTGNKTRVYGNRVDKQFMNSFKSRAVACLNFVPQNDWEWMSTAQHYGLPTRMLDWTQSALSALFFAVENEEFEYTADGDGPVIWALNPIELNEKVRFVDDYNVIPNIIENNVSLQRGLSEKYGIGVDNNETTYPIALVCPTSNGRINAQKGTFTLFSLNSKPLENMDNIDKILCKIVIEKDNKREIKKQLFEIGITYSNIYPDLEYVCKDIKFEYEKNN